MIICSPFPLRSFARFFPAFPYLRSPPPHCSIRSFRRSTPDSPLFVVTSLENWSHVFVPRPGPIGRMNLFFFLTRNYRLRPPGAFVRAASSEGSFCSSRYLNPNYYFFYVVISVGSYAFGRSRVLLTFQPLNSDPVLPPFKPFPVPGPFLPIVAPSGQSIPRMGIEHVVPSGFPAIFAFHPPRFLCNHSGPPGWGPSICEPSLLYFLVCCLSLSPFFSVTLYLRSFTRRASQAWARISSTFVQFIFVFIFPPAETASFIKPISARRKFLVLASHLWI